MHGGRGLGKGPRGDLKGQFNGPGGLSWGPSPVRAVQDRGGPCPSEVFSSPLLLYHLHKDRGEKQRYYFSCPILQVGKSRPRDIRSACQPQSEASGPVPSVSHKPPQGSCLGMESGSLCRLGFLSLSPRAWLPGLGPSDCVTAGPRFHCWESQAS